MYTENETIFVCLIFSWLTKELSTYKFT